MKPLYIHLKNTGPFIDQEIDFTRLDDIFLITGKTGSGKTTIFDAITYALYGELSGIKSTKKIKLHSDFAPADEKAFVDFKFYLNGKEQRVCRTVQDEYINRNGKKTTRAAEVTYSVCSSNGQWQEITGKTTEINEKLTAQLGLTKEEFTKIVILPQGEFAKFLHDDPKNRKDTLAKLFPIEQYTRLCEKIKQDAKEAEDKIKAAEKSLEDYSKDFNQEQAQAFIAEIENKKTELLETNRTTIEKLTELAEQKSVIQEKLTKASEAAELKTNLLNLKSKTQEMDKLKEKAENARKAEFLIPFINQKKQAENTEKNLKQKISEENEKYKKLKSDLKKHKDTENSINEKRTEILELTKKQTLLENDLKNAKDTVLKQNDFSDALKKFISNYSTCKSAFLKSQQESAENIAAIQETEKLINDSESILEKEREQEKTQSIAEKAQELSETLKENEPCPVCGSLTHPAPCKKNLFELFSLDEQIKTLEAAIKQQKSDLKKLLEQKENLSKINSILKTLTDQFIQTAKENNIALPDDKELTPRTKPLPSAEDLAEKTQTISSTVQKLIMTQENLKSAAEKTEKSPQEIQEMLDLSLNKIKNLTEECSLWDNEKNELEKKLTRADSDLENLKKNLENAEKDLAEKTEYLNLKIKDSAFNTPEDAESKILNSEETDEIENTVRSWEQELSETQIRIKAIKETPEDMEKLSQELSALNELYENTKKQKDQTLSEISELDVQKGTIEAQIVQFKTLTQAYQTVYGQNKNLIKLENDINGSNPKKQPLDAWILSTYLDEVIEYANLYFKRISSGRYKFILKTDSTGGHGIKGLDITVNDSYTGKERATASLSGGETFMASLSLALALTDVVQQKSGGIKLDSLFIDEGFGSLDGETLDMAINILEEVREQRMVGIISHVDSIYSTIKCHINVKKGITGSTIELAQGY